MRGIWNAWERFWFSPRQTSTLALVRIAFGLVVLAWTLTVAHDAGAFFGDDGIVPGALGTRGASWTLLDVWSGDAAVTLLLIVLACAGVCLIVGQSTRLSALVVFLAIASLERRDPFAFNSGDGLLRIIAFYLMLAPSGASLSIDRWRRARAALWDFPARAPWALRLMQVQLSVVYLSGLWAKLSGPTWNDGTAVSYAVRLEDLARFDMPHAIATSELAVSLLTYGTLAIEAAIGILVWNRRLRPWVLGLGAAFHIGIDLTIRVGFFSYAILVLYLAFLSPAVAGAGILQLEETASGPGLNRAGTTSWRRRTAAKAARRGRDRARVRRATW